jgi:hypothetical protein
MAHQLTAEGGANLAPTALGQTTAEGGADTAPTAGHVLLAEGGANLEPTAPDALGAEGGANLSPTALGQTTAEGGADLTPTAPDALGAEGGANLSPTALGQTTAEGGANLSPTAPVQFAGEYAAAVFGTRQAVKLTVAGTITVAGIAGMTLTGLLVGPGLAYEVSLAEGDTDAVIAAKLIAIINADPNIGGVYVASGSGADVVVTAATPEANDATFALAISTPLESTLAGLTPSESVAYVAGVAGPDIPAQLTPEGGPQ